jgi:hypothetical protein
MIGKITKEIMAEFEKPENHDKLKANFIQPILAYILKWILPYFIIIVILFTLMIILLLIILVKINR